jgi:hypothetical protein
MTSAQPYAGLLEKLVAVDDVEMGGVCEVTVLRNPDGPEAAEAISSLLKRVGELRELLVKYAVHEEFDYPGDAPESCGLWCNICNQHVDDDNPAIGHAETCALNSDASTQTVGEGL